MNLSTYDSESHITEASTLFQTIPLWVIFLRDQKKSLHTIKSFQGDMNLFAGFSPSDKSIGAITTHDINNFLDWLQTGRGIPCSPKSFARRITSIKSFFRWLSRNGRILVDPAEPVLQQSVLSPLPSVLSSEEHYRILQKAIDYRTQTKQDARYFALYRLLVATGIKKSECLALHQNHIDLEAVNGPYLFVRYSQPGNRYKERKLNLPEDWVSGYREYLEQYHPVDLVFPWSQRRLEYLLEELSNEANVSKHLSFDMCRWTSALLDWQADVESDSIRQKLGISKIQWREVSLKLKQLAEKTGDISDFPG